MASATHKHVIGASALTKALQDISTEVRVSVLKEAVANAIAPILVAAKRYAKRSERTGALRESLTTKVVNYPRNGVAVGLVGPSKDYYSRGKKLSKTGRALSAMSGKGPDRPANYAHLVEYGHVVVRPVKGTTIRKGTAQAPRSGKTWVPGKPFMRPAVVTTHAAQASGFQSGMERGFVKMYAKLANKGAA